MNFKKYLLGIFILTSSFSISQNSHEETKTFVYDNLNRLVQVIYNDGTTTQYTYDNLGNRLQKDVFVNPVDLTYVPDDNFELKLIDLGYDDILDDYVLTDNIDDVIFLFVGNENISDLTGIEDFSSLENLECFSNNLVSIDISQNSNLVRLYCASNQLINLDVSQNPNLSYLFCFDNQLTSLNLTQNYNLLELDFDSNQIINIDVSNNSSLISLLCGSNSITTIDLSNNPDLVSFVSYSNQLQELNVKNGNNQILTLFSSLSNPNLFCIEVDDEVAANNGSGIYSNWEVDPIVMFSESCILDINDIVLSSEIIITPNPTSNYLSILFPDTIMSNESTIVIYDINGRLLFNEIFEMNNKEVQVSVSKLSNGIYFIKAINNQQNWVQQFIKY